MKEINTVKRAELKVGDELYCATPRIWSDNVTGDRVVVLSTEPHIERSGYVPSGQKWYSTVKSGPGVLVKRYRAHSPDSTGYDEVVQLGHLRGPYEAILAKVQARQGEANKERDAQAARGQLISNAEDAVVGLANKAGVEAFAGSRRSVVQVPVADLLDLLRRAYPQIDATAAQATVDAARQVAGQ
jgi:hypothetical protein